MEWRGTEIGVPGQPAASRGYLALPAGAGPWPGVVVVHEIDGLTDGIRRCAERLAGAGFAALAVDLFGRHSRAVCMARLLADVTLRPLDNRAVRDLRAALTSLGRRPEVDADRLGAVGFCMGGSYAVAWACTDARLKAVAPYYASNPRPLAAARRLCPVVGSYPGRDFTARAGRKLERVLEQAGIPHDIKVYPGARHAFANEERASYDPAASADAWTRVLTFFDERLAPPAPPTLG